MKEKSDLLIFLKIIVVCVLVWYLPTNITDGVSIINAIVHNEEPTVAAPVSKDKRIHIYNSHQSEEYVDYNVIEGAHYLKDLLNGYGFTSTVEETDFLEYMSQNNMTYSQSYVVSKKYLEQRLESSEPYDLIIDFHRDSIPKSLASIEHQGLEYVKIMFVVGESSGRYESVLDISKQLSDRMEAKVPGISRGVYQKNSHYNQGITDNMILIEVGGFENTKDEVKRTIELFAEVINDYLEG
jgi:stage II sporulation protein P